MRDHPSTLKLASYLLFSKTLALKGVREFMQTFDYLNESHVVCRLRLLCEIWATLVTFLFTAYCFSTGGHPTAFWASGGASWLEERPAGLCCNNHMAGRVQKRLTWGLMRQGAEITASSAGKHAISCQASVCSAWPSYLSTSHMQEGLAFLAEPNLQLLFASVVYVNCVNYPEGFGGRWTETMCFGILKSNNKKRVYAISIS